MQLGVPKEIKSGEFRVGLTPAGVLELSRAGQKVLVQSGCGCEIGFSDRDYQQAGAELVSSAEDIYRRAQLIVKVKEPQAEECKLLRPGQLLFAYLHLAADRQLTEALLVTGASCIAYETVTDPAGRLPLLAPMSEVAGRLATQAGAHHLELAQGGRGVLLGGVPGVAPAKVVIVGGGMVGTQAARIAVGMGADVTLLDKSIPRLRELDDLFGGRVSCEYATAERLEALALEADLLIGAVLVAGAAAPKLLSSSQIEAMLPGSVVVDVAIDQGGCFATSRPTSHQVPTYKVGEVVHYCVANIPSAVARTATMALTHATLPHVLALAKEGLAALKADKHRLAGLNIHAGEVTQAAVAASLDYPYRDPISVLRKR